MFSGYIYFILLATEMLFESDAQNQSAVFWEGKIPLHSTLAIHTSHLHAETDFNGYIYILHSRGNGNDPKRGESKVRQLQGEENSTHYSTPLQPSMHPIYMRKHSSVGTYIP